MVSAVLIHVGPRTVSILRGQLTLQRAQKRAVDLYRLK